MEAKGPGELDRIHWTATCLESAPPFEGALPKLANWVKGYCQKEKRAQHKAAPSQQPLGIDASIHRGLHHLVQRVTVIVATTTQEPGSLFR